MYTTPSTIDFLRPNGFVFVVDSMPNVTFSCQAVTLPGLTLGSADQKTPLIDLPHPGEKLVFSPLSIRFIITENMDNYAEILRWLVGLGFPDSQQQYQDLINQRSRQNPSTSRNSVERDTASLFILSSNNQPIRTFKFTDIFPVSINVDEFDLTTTSLEYMTASATFLYQKFELK